MTTIPPIVAPEADEWTVELTDSDHNKVHEVVAGQFAGVIRRNEPGQWSLDVPMAELGEDLCCPDQATIGGVRVLRNGDTVFAGWVARLPSGGGGSIRTVSADERMIRFEGVDAWYPLTTRLVFPDPTTDAPWGDAYDTRTGIGSTIAAGFISDNVGSTALADRVWPDLVISDNTVGTSGTWSARLEQLSSLVGRICDESEIVCRPTVDNQNRPVIRLQARKDRTASLVLSDQAELSDSEVASTPAASTWVLAAGAGEGTSRTFASSGSDTGAARVERITEQSNATTTGELEQIAEVIRRDDAVALHVDGQVSTLTALRHKFGEAYDVGDVVSVQVGGARFPVPVTSVRIEVGPQRSVAVPVLGVFSPDRLQGLRRDVLGLADRFDNNIS